MIEINNMIITAIGVPTIENNLIFMGDQTLDINDLSFINVLFILEMEACFVSGILLAKASNL